MVHSHSGREFFFMTEHDFAYFGQQSPTLSSSMLEWERAVARGHATHPVGLISVYIKCKFIKRKLMKTKMHRTRWPHPPFCITSFSELVAPKVCLVRILRSAVHLGGAYEHVQETWLAKLFGKDSIKQLLPDPDYVAVPVHALQLPVVASLFPSAEHVAGVSVRMEAQMSWRTMQPRDTSSCFAQYHLKLPVNMTTTSATRTISPYSVYNGPVVSEMCKSVVKDTSGLFVCAEVASVGVKVDPASNVSAKNAKQLAAIIRLNPEELLPNERIIPCASLVEQNVEGVSHVVRVFELHSMEKRKAFLTR
jgi:siderophore synthetase component